MTAEEIIKEIKENNLQKILFYHSDYPGAINYTNLGHIEIVYYVCNSDEMYTVVLFKDYNIYIKIEGEYDSYGNGDHFYEGVIKEVFPKQVTITKYE